jgi:hypothetical protein
MMNEEIDNSFDFHFFVLIKKVKTNIFSDQNCKSWRAGDGAGPEININGSATLPNMRTERGGGSRTLPWNPKKYRKEALASVKPGKERNNL